MQTFTTTTLGCKLNQYESQAIAKVLRQNGLAPACPDRPAALEVVCTCCITTTAMRKSRQAIRQAIRRSPGGAVLVMGCYADYAPRRIRDLLNSAGAPPQRCRVVGHHGDVAGAAEQAVMDLAGQTPPAAQGQPTDAGKTAPAEPAARTDAAAGADAYGSPGADTVSGAAGRTSHRPAPQAEPGYDSDYTDLARRRQHAARSQPAGTSGLPAIDRFEGHQRAFVKVQDGCDAFCSYCIVPYTRPVVRSRSRGDILRECRDLISAGHREIVLSGCFLGAWNRPTTRRERWSDPRGDASGAGAAGDRRRGDSPHRPDLPDLLAAVAELPGLWRVRLSSLEPGDVTDRLLGVLADHPTVAPHLHLPMQSGSERVLRHMNRQYTAADFARAAERLTRALDRPAISADVIVGFPGETDADFQATCRLAHQTGLCKIHAFPFSPVPPAPASRLPGRADRATVKTRLARLADLEADLAERYRRQFLGETVEALVESTPAPDPGGNRVPGGHGETRAPAAASYRQALTDRYQTIVFRAPAGVAADHLTGRVVRLRITATAPTGLLGKPVGDILAPSPAG